MFSVHIIKIARQYGSKLLIIVKAYSVHSLEVETVVFEMFLLIQLSLFCSQLGLGLGLRDTTTVHGHNKKVV